SKFAYDEWEALFEHHGFYEMSAIGFYASMIESRREQEAEAKLNNLQLAVELLSSRGVEGVTVATLLNGSNESKELLDIAMKILGGNKTITSQSEASLRSSENINIKNVRNEFLKHLIEKNDIELDRDGFCNLKKDEVWDKLHSSYEEYINYVTKNKKPLKEYPNCIYHYM
ncbi:hypothetical protein, partial [Ostreibacterium oceani]|uniref:hypothetical protein n=1 Tax=Ostreibacterium oceani TaxID=2654998 RepID=UPI001C405FF9